MRVMLSKILCWLGLHRWDLYLFEDGFFDERSECGKPGKFWKWDD